MPDIMYNNEQEITYDAIRIGLASPEKIREWSEASRKPETINYRTKTGKRMACSAKILDSKDWECHCGKYKIRYKGVVCDRCGDEVTKASVRREMGHIELAAPDPIYGILKEYQAVWVYSLTCHQGP